MTVTLTKFSTYGSGPSLILLVPVADIDDPSAELNVLSLVQECALILAFQTVFSGQNECTLYAWDSSPSGAEDVPKTVDGASGGRWVAIGGKYDVNAGDGGCDFLVCQVFD